MRSFSAIIIACLPGALYYRIEHDTIRIYAIFDNRRNPQRIRKRLNRRRESK
jgi:hypothetical protein